jgi:hypothetical protein
LKFCNIALAENAVAWLQANAERISSIDGVSQGEIDEQRESIKDELVTNLRRLIRKPEKIRSDSDQRGMSLSSTIKALENPAFDVKPGSLAHLYDGAYACANELEETAPTVAADVRILFMSHLPEASTAPQYNLLSGNVTAPGGRNEIKKKITGQLKGLGEKEKLDLLSEVLADFVNAQKTGASEGLDKLVAIKYIAQACEGEQNDAPLSLTQP